MRLLFGWLSVMVLASGCSSNLALSPTAASTQSTAPSPHLAAGAGEWSPWYFWGWQPGICEPLTPGVNVEAIVQAGEQCVAGLRQTWDARASCRRFVVSVHSTGTLTAFLQWDASAPGFDASRAGDLVFVKPDGQFADSDWQQTEVRMSSSVQPGDYGVLVMTYVPASLPFQIRVDLREH